MESQITGMMVQAASRILKEEVKFSTTNVTSVDWVSYPMLRFAESPEVTAIVIKRQINGRPAPARKLSRRRPQRSPTRSSMPLACACASIR